MQIIDRLLVELKSLEQQAAKLNELKESVRKEIFGIVAGSGAPGLIFQFLPVPFDGVTNELRTRAHPGFCE